MLVIITAGGCTTPPSVDSKVTHLAFADLASWVTQYDAAFFASQVSFGLLSSRSSASSQSSRAIFASQLRRAR